MQDGTVNFQYKTMLGYKKGTDGKPEIVPEEAAIIHSIYMDYAAGFSLQRIRERLEAAGIPSLSNKDGWAKKVLRSILSNEKYAGDALLQKTYRVDCISKKVRKNNGELPMYLVKNNHPAIISRELWDEVQEEAARRSSIRRVDQKTGRTKQGRFSSKYALSGKMVCGECGAPYKRITWYRKGGRKIVWRCTSRLENGTTFCKESPSIEEPALQAAILKAVNRFHENIGEVMDTVRGSVMAAMAGGEGAGDIVSLRERLVELKGEVERLVGQIGTANAQGIEQQLLDAAKEQEEIQRRIMECEQRSAVLKKQEYRIKKLAKVLDERGGNMQTYDEILMMQVIWQVKVESAERVVLVIENGVKVPVDLES